IYPPPRRAKEAINNPKVKPSVVFLCESDHFKMPVTHSVKRCSCFSKAKIKRPKKVLLLTRSSFPNREERSGTIVNDASRASMGEIITTTQSSRTMFGTIALLIAIGKKNDLNTSPSPATVSLLVLVGAAEGPSVFSLVLMWWEV